MSTSRLTRRAFLGAPAALALGGCNGRPPLAGGIVGPDATLGHRVRDGGFPAPSSGERCRIVVVGGGIAGLAAARRLVRSGISGVVLLELESQAGGNARWGSNAVSAYPWGAHYLPIPGSAAAEIKTLLAELGVIEGFQNGLPVYREEFLCHDPVERLFRLGRWQDGLVPEIGLTRAERSEIESFLQRMHAFKAMQGMDDRPAFVIPVDRSSRDPAILDLDRITMADWLRREGYSATPLLWYVDYCCRDDYGGPASVVSAWAGLHYFASRDGAAVNAPPYAVLTWPEGNGWLANCMRSDAGPAVRTRAVAFKVEADDNRAQVDWFDASSGRSVRTEAEAVIVAAPRFVAARLMTGAAPTAPLPTYAPWVVSNLTLSAPPAGRGAPLAWDNVDERSRSLGYVVANHQHLRPYLADTVITHYQPLDHSDPVTARREALSRSWGDWVDAVLDDLSGPHPEIRRITRRLDVQIWAHGMVRPGPGFIWGPERAAMADPAGRMFFAHSDMSGLSLFEEAYIRGWDAAARAAGAIGAQIT
jgi:NAD(P)-binding Rossmann-like domain